MCHWHASVEKSRSQEETKSKRDGKDSDTLCLFACIWSIELTKISDVDFECCEIFLYEIVLGCVSKEVFQQREDLE
jgi:hypothetical protein